jgi:excinuclease UvrABC ATPase subunit
MSTAPRHRRIRSGVARGPRAREHPCACGSSFADERRRGRGYRNGLALFDDLHCADCDIHYREPTPSLFSFNSSLGACDTCRGFGRVIGIDFGLVIPDVGKTLRGGAIKPWQTESNRECQEDLLRFARKRGIPLDTPWRDLSAAQQHWVLEGEGPWDKKVWYGVRRFFQWLEGRSYKMHVRVLLSKYRSYTPCHTCNGARLKQEALLWRLATREQPGPGLNIHELIVAAARPVPRVLRSHCAACTARRGDRPAARRKFAHGSASWCAWVSGT